jgi:hypothetical protein
VYFLCFYFSSALSPIVFRIFKIIVLELLGPADSFMLNIASVYKSSTVISVLNLTLLNRYFELVAVIGLMSFIKLT